MSSSKSSTAANTSTTTNNQDQRLSVEEGALGATASTGGTVNITQTSGRAFDVVEQSIDKVMSAHEAGSDGLFDAFGKLLDAGKYVVDANTQMANDTMKALAPTNSALTEQDSNKSMLVAVGIGAAALVLMNRK